MVSNVLTPCIRHQVIGQGNPNNDRKPHSWASCLRDRRNHPLLLPSRSSHIFNRLNVEITFTRTFIRPFLWGHHDRVIG
ncbi:MAG: hypothetical protein CMJ33_00890 [Phycisphaerae bacterium]|nr:hypothetical protein [Phycisphaerae bacterium]